MLDRRDREKWTRQDLGGGAQALSEHKGVPDPCYPSWGFSLQPDLTDVETEAWKGHRKVTGFECPLSPLSPMEEAKEPTDGG